MVPMTEDIRIKSIVKAPLKEVILAKLMQICTSKNLNITWIDETNSPDKVWLVNFFATVDPTIEFSGGTTWLPPSGRSLKKSRL